MRFVVEHAKRGQASCKFTKCKQKIEKGILRIGKVSPSPFAEGSELTQWFHAKCLFDQMKNPRASKLESADDLDGYDELPDTDKQLIDDLIKAMNDPAEASKAGSSKAKKGAKKSKNKDSDDEESEEMVGKRKKGEGSKKKATKSRKKKKTDDSDDD